MQLLQDAHSPLSSADSNMRTLLQRTGGKNGERAKKIVSENLSCGLRGSADEVGKYLIQGFVVMV